MDPGDTGIRGRGDAPIMNRYNAVMHWFWRATIAMAVGSVGGWAFYCLPWYIYPMFADPVIWTGEDPAVQIVWLITFPVTALMTVIPYALLTRFLAPRSAQSRRRR